MRIDGREILPKEELLDEPARHELRHAALVAQPVVDLAQEVHRVPPLVGEQPACEAHRAGPPGLGQDLLGGPPVGDVLQEPVAGVADGDAQPMDHHERARRSPSRQARLEVGAEAGGRLGRDSHARPDRKTERREGIRRRSNMAASLVGGGAFHDGPERRPVAKRQRFVQLGHRPSSLMFLACLAMTSSMTLLRSMKAYLFSTVATESPRSSAMRSRDTPSA
jgi:hypothetical protein